MALLPSVPVTYELTITPVYTTLEAGPTDTNIIQRRSKSPYGALHTLVISADALGTEESTLYVFYSARRGGWEAFQMYDPSIDKVWADVYLGTGNASNRVFPLRGKSTSSRTIYINGVVETHYTVQVGGAADSQDQITFDTGYAPATGAIVKADFTGCRYFPYCIFRDKGLTRKRFEYALYKLGVTIQELSQ